MKKKPWQVKVAGVTVAFRRATSKEWAAHNPILQDEEAGYDLDENKIKVGDGETPWSDLPWFATIHKD